MTPSNNTWNNQTNLIDEKMDRLTVQLEQQEKMRNIQRHLHFDDEDRQWYSTPSFNSLLDIKPYIVNHFSKFIEINSL